MRKSFLFLAFFFANASVFAGYRTTTTQLWTLVTNTDCMSYLVTIWDDHNSDNPHEWTAVAAKIVLSDGCDGIDIGEPMATTTHYSVIQSVGTDGNGCTEIEVNVYDGSGILTATDIINLCVDEYSAKRDISSAQEEDKSEFAIYPSVVSTYLTVEESLNSPYTISILNQSGQRVFIEEIGSNILIQNLDLTSLEKGIYFVTIQSKGERLASQKIIKQ